LVLAVAGVHSYITCAVLAAALMLFFDMTGTTSQNIECGPMPNEMATLPNIGGALCSTPQNVANAQYSSAVQ